MKRAKQRGPAMPSEITPALAGAGDAAAKCAAAIRDLRAALVQFRDTFSRVLVNEYRKAGFIP